MQKSIFVSHGYAKKRKKKHRAMTFADMGNNYYERLFLNEQSQ